MQNYWKQAYAQRLFILEAGLSIAMLKLGIYASETLHMWIYNKFGIGSWKTPNFLGNNGRSPIFPYEKIPFADDYEGMMLFTRRKTELFIELLTEYKIGRFQGYVHP